MTRRAAIRSSLPPLPHEPGAINLMTAGRGIVHSERTPKELLGVDRRSHGLQLWLAVPDEREEDRPNFQHEAGNESPAPST